MERRGVVPIERLADVSPGYAANRALDALATACAVAPGICTSVDLPQVIAPLTASS